MRGACRGAREIGAPPRWTRQRSLMSYFLLMPQSYGTKESTDFGVGLPRRHAARMRSSASLLSPCSIPPMYSRVVNSDATVPAGAKSAAYH